MNKLDVIREPYTAEFKDAVHEFVDTQLAPHGLKDESSLTGFNYLKHKDRQARQRRIANTLLLGLAPVDALSVTLVAAGNIRKQDRGPIRYINNRVDSICSVEVIYDDNNEPTFIPIDEDTTKMIPVVKTRTMKNGADRRHTVGHKVQSSDSSVTAAGKILRRKPLNIADEIPQLRQVRRDEMAVVGPRPMFYSELYSPVSLAAFNGNIDALNLANRFYSFGKKGVLGPEILNGQREVSNNPGDTLKRYAAIFGWALYCSPDVDDHIMSEVARNITPVIKTKYEKLAA